MDASTDAHFRRTSSVFAASSAATRNGMPAIPRAPAACTSATPAAAGAMPITLSTAAPAAAPPREVAVRVPHTSQALRRPPIMFVHSSHRVIACAAPLAGAAALGRGAVHTVHAAAAIGLFTVHAVHAQ